MRIKCPYCGERDAQEFTYRGAHLRRPDADASDADASDADAAFYEYVYLRDNPAGPLSELWYHRAGCRSWLVVERDTRTHAVAHVAFAASMETD